MREDKAKKLAMALGEGATADPPGEAPGSLGWRVCVRWSNPRPVEVFIGDFDATSVYRDGGRREPGPIALMGRWGSSRWALGLARVLGGTAVSINSPHNPITPGDREGYLVWLKRPDGRAVAIGPESAGVYPCAGPGWPDLTPEEIDQAEHFEWGADEDGGVAPVASPGEFDEVVERAQQAVEAGQRRISANLGRPSFWLADLASESARLARAVGTLRAWEAARDLLGPTPTAADYRAVAEKAVERIVEASQPIPTEGVSGPIHRELDRAAREGRAAGWAAVRVAATLRATRLAESQAAAVPAS